MVDLLHEIEIDSSSKKVYEAIDTQKGLRSWWTADSVAEPRVGGKAQFGFDSRAVVFSMTIKE